MKRSERKAHTLMQYGIDSRLAEQLVDLGYGATKLRNTSIADLTPRFGEEAAREIKTKISRKPIPEGTLQRLIGECDWACCMCWKVGGSEPVIVHHIEEYAKTQDNSYENLVVLCLNHHGLAHARSALSGDLIPAELLRQRKQEFIGAIAEWKAGKRSAPGGVSETIELSEPLLHELCERNLHQYTREQHFLTDSSMWVSREIDSSDRESAFTIQLLIAEPGFGKSVCAYQALQQHLASGGLGLWIRPHHVEGSSSLACALEKALQELCPSLEPGATEGFKETVPKGTRFLVVVDDVNRTGNPTQVLERLLLWSRSLQPYESELGVPAVSYLMICPVWPRFWEAVKRRFGRETPWVHTLNVGPMSIAESSEALQKASVTPMTTISVNELAYKLGGDPFLVGLAAYRLSKSDQSRLCFLADEIVEQFLADKIDDALSLTDRTSHLVSSDCRQALTKLASRMLQTRNLHPTWLAIRGWLESDPNTCQALWELSQKRDLCRLEPESEILSFRHDRLWETIAVGSIAETLDTSSGDIEVLCEPYYAEWVGHALAHSQPSADLLSEMRDKTPLALVEAIHQFGEPTSDCHQAIINELKRWMRQHQRGGPESIRDAILWGLLRTDSTAVLDVTAVYFDDNWDLWRLLARFRNGCVQSGVEYCEKFGAHPLWSPSPYGALWYQIVEHAKRYHGNEILDKLRALCATPSTNSTHRRGDLILAGFVGSPELVEHVITGWGAQGDKTRFLSHVVLACIRCYSPEHNELLEPLMAYWAESGDTCESIPEESFALLSFGISDAAANYLIAQADKHQVLRVAVARMLGTLDRPNVVEYVVQVAAEVKEEAPDRKPVSTWVQDIVSYWRSAHQRGRGLSTASVGTLRTLWENSQNDDRVRSLAFQLWLTVAEPAQLEVIKSIRSDSPLFSSALWMRMRFADRSAVPDLLPLLSTDTSWFRLAHLIWCDELMRAANQHLAAFSDDIPFDFSGGRLPEHYDLLGFIVRIPTEDATALLRRNWSHLHHSPLFIWAALVVGTPESLMLAEDGISQYPDKEDLFKGCFTYFQWLPGLELTVEHLDNFKPYLDWLNDDELRTCAEICAHLGEAGMS